MAHWDHFGQCAEPPAERLICNGAIDNASGVASLIEIARRLIPLGARFSCSGYFLHQRKTAALEVFREKLVKRSISLKSFEAQDPRSSGKEYKISGTFKAGISQEQAKKLGKLIRDEGPKSVKSQVMGEELRVTSKSRDDLQAVQSLVRDADLDFAVQFVNYR